jgi:hypothetical protein
VPPDSVWCTRDRTLQTPQLRVSRRPLCYNSPDCPVRQAEQWLLRQRSSAKVNSVRWCTGLSGAPIDSSLPQRLNWWLGAINTPQPPPPQPSKHSQQCIQYESKVQHSKTQIKASDPIKVHKINSSALGLVRGSLVFSCCSCCLVGFLLPHSCSQDTCNQSKRHQVVVVLVGV